MYVTDIQQSKRVFHRALWGRGGEQYDVEIPCRSSFHTNAFFFHTCDLQTQ